MAPPPVTDEQFEKTVSLNSKVPPTALTAPPNPELKIDTKKEDTTVTDALPKDWRIPPFAHEAHEVNEELSMVSSLPSMKNTEYRERKPLHEIATEFKYIAVHPSAHKHSKEPFSPRNNIPPLP